MKHALIAGLLTAAALSATGAPVLAADHSEARPGRAGEEIPTHLGGGFDVGQPGEELGPPVAWTSLTDDTGSIVLSVPTAWSAVDLTPAHNADGTAQPWISATTDPGLFFPAAGTADTFAVPGVVYRAYPLQSDTASILQGSEYHDVCTAEPMQTFDDGVFVGHVQTFDACGGTASRIVEVAANTPRGPFTSVLLVQLTGQPDDGETLDRLLTSFDQRLDDAVPATVATAPAGDPATELDQLLDELGMTFTPEQESCFQDNAYLFDPAVPDSVLDVLYTCVTAFFPSG